MKGKSGGGEVVDVQSLLGAGSNLGVGDDEIEIVVDWDVRWLFKRRFGVDGDGSRG